MGIDLVHVQSWTAINGNGPSHRHLLPPPGCSTRTGELEVARLEPGRVVNLRATGPCVRSVLALSDLSISGLLCSVSLSLAAGLRGRVASATKEMACR